MNSPLQPPPPFSCNFTPQIPELLFKLQCSLAISTYQAGKIIFISAKDENQLVQLPRTFNKPMGMALKENKLAVATRDSVIVFRNEKSLAASYPKNPNTYDSFFVPRVTYNTGAIDVHDISWKENELFAVNTAFSCVMKIDDEFSFTPVWHPKFIQKEAPGDFCHLNGLVVLNNELKYATAFNTGDTPQSWRENILNSGVLIDIPSNEIISTDLGMPHSPRVFDGKLFLLLSATGEFISVDMKTGKKTIIKKINGFVRGLAKCGDYVFIGLSRLRKNSSTFAKLPIAEFSNSCGVDILHLPTGAFVGSIRYESSVDEIYDIHILPNTIRPNILSADKPESAMGISTPTDSFWAKEKE